MAHVKKTGREKRKFRIRKSIHGTAERPRLSVFRSNKYVYAQIIDDNAQKTIASASSLKEGKACNIEVAAIVGKTIGEKALAANVKEVIFDRNGYKYHGIVKQLADSAREAGLKF